MSVATGCGGNQGKTFALLLHEKGAGKTILFEVAAVNGVPSLPPDGFKPADRLESLRGAKVVDKLIIPGTNPEQYAYLRQTVQRDLYRIPLR